MFARASVILAVVALALLVVSALPWPGATSGAAISGDPAIAPSAETVAYGKTLFSAKGCASCHYHGAVAGSGQFSGGPGGPPTFTAALTADPAYLRAWLRNPQAQRPTTTMPNLGLSDAEIDALVAFLRDAGAPRP